MIETLIIDYLKTDATLTTLLGASTRYYPLIAPQNSTPPFIVYSEASGGVGETLDTDRVQLNIICTTILAARAIRDRIKVLLDKDDLIQDNITDTTWKVFFCRLSAFDSTYDSDTDTYAEIMFFEVKFIKL